MTLFPEASLDHASHFPLPGNDEARKTTVTSGQKCCALLKSCDPVGSLVKMLLESSVWRSTRCFLTWKPQGTKQGRLLFRLAPSTHRTGENGAPLLPTVRAMESGCYQYSQGKHDHPILTLTGVVKLWPTPTTRDYKGANSMEHLMCPGKKNHKDQLSNAVRLWPTPSASDCGRTAINPHMTGNGTIRHIGKNGKQSYARLDAVAAMFPTPRANAGTGPSHSPGRQGAPDLQTEIGGQLNPDWVEWLMGFPAGWTEV